MISGLLYNEKAKLNVFIRRKIFSLYIPFVFWNLTFCVLRLIVLKQNVLETLKSMIKIALTLSKDGQFLGATWFFGALFFVSIGYKMIDIFLAGFRYKEVSLLVIFGLIALNGIKITLPYMLSRTCILSFYYAVGAYVKKEI